MIERAIEIVITIVIFMIIAYTFIDIFGTPSCQSLANQTAQQLRFAINEVADGTNVLPFQTNDPSFNEPSDSKYYTTVPIRLCQQYGTYSFFQSFLGGMPEYQIYYEKFPEGGGGSWNEAYPWSGGAASSLVFWGAMRGVTFGLKGAITLTRTIRTWKAIQIGYKAMDVAQDRISFFKYLIHPKTFQDILSDKVDEFVKLGRPVQTLIDRVGEEDAGKLLKYFGDAGLIETVQGPLGLQYYAVGDKLVINGNDIPATVVEKVPDLSSPGSFITKPQKVAVLIQPDGTLDWNYVELLDMSAPTPAGYQLQMINPREQMKDIIESLKDSGQLAKAQQLAEDFALDDTSGKTLESALDKPNFLKRISNAVKEKWTYMKDYLKSHLYLGSSEEFATETGYKTATRAQAAEELAVATEFLSDGSPNPVYKFFTLSDGTVVTADDFREAIRPLLKSEDYGKNLIKKIRYFAGVYGIPIAPEVTPDDAMKVLARIWKENGGGLGIHHESSFVRIWNRITDAVKLTKGDAGEIASLPAGGTFSNSYTQPSYVDWMRDELKKLPNYDKWFAPYETQLTVGTAGRNGIISNLQGIYIDLQAKYPALPQEQLNKLFDLEAEKFQWKNFVAELILNEKPIGDPLRNPSEVQEIIKRQWGMVLGIMDKNYDALPVDLERLFGIKYAGKQASKMLFIDGTALVAPNSWLAKGLILGEMTEGCRGNSICLYIQGSQAEAPYYMDENATNYTVRVWRPIEPWKQWAGWQAALQHVPAHPRFYVVSPCFAVAKVWKTSLDGQPTIFVHPIKIEMEGGSSNYCYADTDLINAYTTIWAASDAATVIETVMSLGVRGATKGASLVLKNALSGWGLADPTTFFQCIAEGAISWPGYPYTGMNYTDMLESNENTKAFNELQSKLESAYG